MPAFVPPGVIGHNRSLFARNYAILPPDGMFPSLLPGLRNAQVYYQATPLMGARFAQGTLEVLPGGGTTAPRDDGYEHFLYVQSGTLEIAAGRESASLAPGGFAYVPAGTSLSFVNTGEAASRSIWIKRRYVPPPARTPPRRASAAATPRRAPRSTTAAAGGNTCSAPPTCRWISR